MQYEVNFFRVDTVAIDAATESITDTITHRAGYKTSKDGKRTKWAWHKITDGDLQNARQAIQRFKSANFPKRDTVEELRQAFNPYSGFVAAFLQWLLEYPRIQIYVRDIPNHVEIGGVEYIDADTPPPNFEMSLNGALDEYEYSTGGFDNQCTAFKKYVAWVGNKANCNRAAQNVILAFDALVETLGECGINEFADLGKAYERTTKALEEMCAALADTQTQTAHGKSKAKQERTRYPKDSEALGVLQEAKRRKGTKSYSDCSNADIIKCMITEQQSKWIRRVLYGKLKRKAGRLEHSTPINAEKAAANWGKYLSAYLKDYPLKQCI